MAKRKRRDKPHDVEHFSAQHAPSSGNSEQASRDRVAARAYELYLARGGAHGADWDDWLAAERELIGSSSGAGTSPGQGKREK